MNCADGLYQPPSGTGVLVCDDVESRLTQLFVTLNRDPCVLGAVVVVGVFTFVLQSCTHFYELDLGGENYDCVDGSYTLDYVNSSCNPGLLPVCDPTGSTVTVTFNG